MDSPPQQKSPHILILDDDTAHQELCLRAFRDDPERYRVSIATSVRKAREIIESDPPDLIIADWVLPEGKGIDILPRTYGNVTIPLIIMTSYGDERLAVEIMKSGAIDYIVKSATMFRDLPHIARRALRDWENIQNRKQAESAVRDSEKRLADVINFLPDATLAIDREGRVIAWNKALEEMTGVASADILGKGDHAYSIPFYGERRPILIDLVLMDDAEVEKKYNYIQRDGEQITSETFIPTLFGGKGAYLWGTASPLYDSLGNRVGAIEVIRDITKRKLAEQELVSAQQRLKEAHHLAHIGTWEWIMENDTVTWSEELYNITGRDPTLPAPSYAEHSTLYTPPSWDRLSAAVTQTLSTGEPYNLELELVRPDGHLRWVNAFGGVKRDGEGRIIGLHGTLQDISDRKLAELALQKSEVRFRHISGLISDFTYSCTKPPKGGFLIDWITGAFERITGYPEDEILSMSCWRGIVVSEDQPIFDEKIAGLQPGSSQRCELRIHTKAGAIKWLLCFAECITDPAEPTTSRLYGGCQDITDQKTAQHALALSEERFHNLFDNMSAGVVIYEPTSDGEDFIIRDINRAGETIDQVKKEDIVGKLVQEVYPGVMEFGIIDVFHRVATTGIAESHPVSIYHDNRISGWRENYVYKLPSGEVVAIYEDVTDKKQAEGKLRESEEKARTLMNVPTIAAFIIDREGMLLDVNETVLKGYGRPADKILGRSIWVLFSPPVAESRKIWVENAIRTKEGVRYEDENEGRYYDVVITPLTDSRGEVSRLAIIAFDITALKTAQKSLAESEKRYHTLIDHLPDYVIVHQDGILLYVNPAAAARIGYDAETLIGKPILPFIAPEYHDAIRKATAQRMSGIELPSYEIKIITKDGSFRTVLVNGAMILYEGRPASLNVLTDITRIKQADEVRKAYELRLDSAMDIGSLAWWEMDLPGGAVQFDDRKATMLGYSPNQFHHYTDFTALLHPDDYEPAVRAMRDHLEGRELRYHVDYRLRTAAGDYRWFRDVGGITRRHSDGAPATVTGIVIDITAGKEAEDALRKSQIHLGEAMDLAHLVNWEFDVPTGIFTFDDRFYALYASTAELEGGYEMPAEEYARRFIPADEQQIVAEEIRKAVETDDPYYVSQIEHRIIRRDGEVRTIIVRFAIIKDAHGRTIKTFGANQDITEQKKMEQALLESETRFRALIQNSSDIIRILDRNGLIIYESPSAERILGYSPGYMIGKNPLDFIHSSDRERVQSELAEVFEQKNAGIPTEFRIRKADGEYIWVDTIGTNLLGVPGVDGVVVTTRPIQQRKEAEEALADSEERLRLALEGADIASWDWNLVTGNAVFSDRFYTMLDYQPGEFPATYEGWIAHIHPDDRERILPDLQKQIAEKRPLCEIEYRLLTKDGNWIWVLGRGKIADVDEKGDPIRLTGVNIDITNRRLMESEIRSLNIVLEQRVKERTEALETTNKALKEENLQRLEAETKLQGSYDEKVLLLKEIHHRVKNNLQIIASLLNLQSRYIKDESTLAAIRESQNRVKAMALVHEKLYRSEDIAHISLQDYIRFLGTGLFQFYDARTRGIQFTLDIHDVDVDIDAAIPLGLILNELISNSLKYAFPDGRKGEIAVSVKKEDLTLTVLFRDNGIGIPADLDWQNTQSLGLRLVNTLVDQMNGTIELDRTAGTQFTLVVHEKEQRGNEHGSS